MIKSLKNSKILSIFLIGVIVVLISNSGLLKKEINEAPIEPDPIIEDESQFPSIYRAQKDLFKSSDKQYENAEIWFENNFNIGKNQFHTKFFATHTFDENGNPNDCHSCPQNISVVTYKLINSKWTLIASQMQFAESGSWGTVTKDKPSLLLLSPKSIAVLINSSYGNMGYFVEGKEVYVFENSYWHAVGFIQTGGDNSGSCDENASPDVEDSLEACYKFEGKISVADMNSGPYPNILVMLSGTVNTEDRFTVKEATDEQYKFMDGQYKLVPHDGIAL